MVKRKNSNYMVIFFYFFPVSSDCRKGIFGEQFTVRLGTTVDSILRIAKILPGSKYFVQVDGENRPLNYKLAPNETVMMIPKNELVYFPKKENPYSYNFRISNFTRK